MYILKLTVFSHLVVFSLCCRFTRSQLSVANQPNLTIAYTLRGTSCKDTHTIPTDLLKRITPIRCNLCNYKRYPMIFCRIVESGTSQFIRVLGIPTDLLKRMTSRRCILRTWCRIVGSGMLQFIRVLSKPRSSVRCACRLTFHRMYFWVDLSENFVVHSLTLHVGSPSARSRFAKSVFVKFDLNYTGIEAKG